MVVVVVVVEAAVAHYSIIVKSYFQIHKNSKKLPPRRSWSRLAFLVTLSFAIYDYEVVSRVLRLAVWLGCVFPSAHISIVDGIVG